MLAIFYDRVLQASERAGLREDRRALLAHARGEVLEIGAGTGLNLALYPRTGVERIVVSEPDRHMARRLRGRVGGAPAPVEIVGAGGEDLPFGDASFDTVVATLLLCSVADPAIVLAEVARVLRPGGRFLFLEHVRAHDAGLARWQDRLTPLWKVVAGNCHPNRSTLATLRASPLVVIDVTEGRIPKAAPIVRPRIAGMAERPPTVEQPSTI
ncbi:MAG: class SAM-dependent methyltransferase [Solirubrobacterales bacterium]|nr:class SAM-dependent methyltransferase [Solirubrobacterales bacterium]